MVSVRLGWQNHSEKPLSTPNLAPETRLLGGEACRLRLLLSGDLVAIHKPPGLSSDAAMRRLSARRGTALTRVSRLDLATSGVLLAAVGEETTEPAWPAPYSPSVELWGLGWVVPRGHRGGCWRSSRGAWCRRSTAACAWVKPLRERSASL